MFGLNEGIYPYPEGSIHDGLARLGPAEVFRVPTAPSSRGLFERAVEFMPPLCPFFDSLEQCVVMGRSAGGWCPHCREVIASSILWNNFGISKIVHLKKENSCPFQRVREEPGELCRGRIWGGEKPFCIYSRGRIFIRQEETFFLKIINIIKITYCKNGENGEEKNSSITSKAWTLTKPRLAS